MNIDEAGRGGGGRGGKQSLREAVKFSDLFFRPERPRDYIVLLARFLILACLAASISFVLHTAFSFSGNTLCLPCSQRKSDLFPSLDTASRTNLSHVQFCIAGARDTWNDRSRYTSLWWGNSTRGFAWLDKLPVAPLKNDTDNRLTVPVPVRISDPGWNRFRYSSSKAAVRIARIIWDSYRLNLPDVRWFVMGDDDTVFFTQNLISILARYDHNQMWYIGANSESVEQDDMHSYDMAFGGGGFAVSRPLAKRLAGALDGCLNRYSYFYGSDQRIAACISELGVPFTAQQGFHQLDIRGDPYGLLSAHPLAPLISLHHLDYLEPMFPNQNQTSSLQTLMKSYAADPTRILQQTFCYDRSRNWSISISWGYSVQIYRYYLSAIDLKTPLQTFKTWRSWQDGPFTFNTRPVKSDPCERPVVYFLDRVVRAGDGGTRSRYARDDQRNGTCGKEDTRAVAVKTVVVSSTKMDKEYWNKAPRRQCCEVKGGGGIKNGKMLIRIRNCRSSESISI